MRGGIAEYDWCEIGLRIGTVAHVMANPRDMASVEQKRIGLASVLHDAICFADQGDEPVAERDAPAAHIVPPANEKGSLCDGVA